MGALVELAGNDLADKHDGHELTRPECIAKNLATAADVAEQGVWPFLKPRYGCDQAR